MMMCPRSGLERLNNTYRHALARRCFWRSKQLAIVLGFLDDSRTREGLVMGVNRGVLDI